MSTCYLSSAKPAALRQACEIHVLKIIGFCLLVLMLVSIAAAKSPAPAHGAEKQHQTRFGLASYYGKCLQGKKTAAGETFDKNQICAAHPTYPLGTRLKVTNLRNGRTVNVRVNDRGPVKKHRAQGVIIDLSEQAARELGFQHQGKTRVKTEVIEWGEGADKTAAAEPVIATAAR